MSRSPAPDEAVSDDLHEQVAALHERLHLANVRVQRLRAETLEDPPLDVDKIIIHASPYEVLLEPPRFAARFTQTVTLQDEEELSLAEVEVSLIVEYTLDEGPEPSQEATGLYIDHNVYFTAHPYLREALQNVTLKLGIDPVILGVLSRDKPRPTEVTLVRRTNPQTTGN